MSNMDAKKREAIIEEMENHTLLRKQLEIPPQRLIPSKISSLSIPPASYDAKWISSDPAGAAKVSRMPHDTITSAETHSALQNISESARETGVAMERLSDAFAKVFNERFGVQIQEMFAETHGKTQSHILSDEDDEPRTPEEDDPDLNYENRSDFGIF